MADSHEDGASEKKGTKSMGMIAISGGAMNLRFLQSIERRDAEKSSAIQRLSTGKRINAPRDDPSGYVAAESLRGELTVLGVRVKSLDALDQKLSLKESLLAIVQDVLISLRGKLVGATGDQTTADEKVAIQEEIDGTIDALDLVAKTVPDFPGVHGLGSLRRGGSANVIDGDTTLALSHVDAAIRGIGLQRITTGSFQRAHLDPTRSVAISMIEQHTKALSLIEDTDFAEEASRLVAAQVLSDAAFAALAFSNREQMEQLQELLKTFEDGVIASR